MSIVSWATFYFLWLTITTLYYVCKRMRRKKLLHPGTKPCPRMRIARGKLA